MIPTRIQVTDNLNSIVATSEPVLDLEFILGKRWLSINSDIIGLFMSYFTT